MNLALHGFLLQVFVSILDFQHGSLLCSAGEPGYLDFDNLPETNFSCQGKVIGGYYADVEAGCQMFHVCTIGQKDEIMDIKFLCLNGTVFDQETRVCERVDEVDCSKSERFYNLNLELYGNNAVTLSLHEHNEDEDGPSESVDDHQQRTTSVRPTTTTTTSTTTARPNKPSTTSAPSSFSHPTGYPQHYQPQPPFPQVHTSQSKSLYDDKNGGYHHQYIFHNGERSNNQATSYQLFSNQGVSSTTVQTPQLHQIRFSSTASPQIIHNEPSTVAPLFHATSSTIQTLLNSNGNSPALINPIFHNHGIASTTEQFSIHSNNPRETSDYRESVEQGIRPLEAVQSTNKGKVSKLTISPVPTQSEAQRSTQSKVSHSSQQQRISGNFLPTPSSIETTIRSFYPTPRSSSKPTQTSQPTNDQVTQHIHLPPPVAIPQLKPHQITINLPPPTDLQRIVQNPSSLLSTQSRVIVTAKASVSDESGRPLNTTQLVTIPLPTIPASYDDYKEGDESFDPFYRDVPKIRNHRRSAKNSGGKSSRRKRALGQARSPSGPFVYDRHSGDRGSGTSGVEDKSRDGAERFVVSDDVKDFQSIKESLMRFRDMLFSGEITDEAVHNVFGNSKSGKDKLRKMEMLSGGTKSQVSDEQRLKDTNKEEDTLEDLETKASKHLQTRKHADGVEDDSEDDGESKLEAEESNVEIPLTSEAEEYVDTEEEVKNKSDSEDYSEKDASESDTPGSEEELEDSKDYGNAGESKERKPEESGEFSLTEDYEEPPLDSGTGKSSDDYPHTEVAVDIDGTSAPKKSENIRSEAKRTKVDDAKRVENERVIDVVILDADEHQKTQAPEQETTETPTERDAYSSTEVPALSTTEQITESASDDSTRTDDATEATSEVKESTKDLKEHQAHDEGNDTEDKNEDAERVTLKASTEKNEPKESTEPKASPKRKSSRIRPRGKISSRKKQYRDDNGDIHSLIEDGHDVEKVSSVVHLGTNADQINSHIFDEPESQTSKEVEVRAVGQNDSNYVKSLQESKGQDTGKDSRKGEAGGYEALKKNPNNLEKHRDGLNEFHTTEKEADPLESTASTPADREEDKKEEDFVGEKEALKEVGHSTKTDDFKAPSTEYSTATMEGVAHSVEEKKYHKEVSTSSVEEYDAMGDETTMMTNSKETEEGSVEMHKEKVVFHAVKKSSRYGMARKFDDPPKEVKVTDEEKDEEHTTEHEKLQSHEHLTVKSIEQMHSDEETEYRDSTEASYESTREEMSKEDDYKESESPNDDDTSTEHDSSHDSASKEAEDVEESTEVDKSAEMDEDESTEGVLKFTDELPKTDDKDDDAETKKSSVSVENAAQDYVDDNYEPDNYKEGTPSTEPGDLMDEKTDKSVLDHKMEVKKETSKVEDVESTTLLQETMTEETTKFKEEQPEDSEKEEVESTTVLTTTSSTTPSTTTTSTTSTTTTTVRPTPPKLFKPISARKSYNYIPPTSTPNPVIIKPRIGLFNPKPAKPPKSYNDLVPKPVIRKFPILLRKTTTQPSTTTVDKDSEESETTVVPLSTTTETSRSEENVLEGKLETREEAPSTVEKKENQDSTKGKDDQIPNASEQKTPSKLDSKAEEENQNKDTDNFTPYPISRLSTLGSTIGKTSKDMALVSKETEKPTTQPSFTSTDVDAIRTTTLAATILPSRSEYVDTSTTKLYDEETSTVPPTRSQYQDLTEFGTTSEVPTTTEGFTTPRVEPDVTENANLGETTTMRAFKRKSWATRKEGGFNCLEKEMYRFYGDTRDCRLFHYCSPGFTPRQVLDFRFVCEEGTSFDEESQSCRHDVRNRECSNRPW